ncbi:MAG: hypothetical protein CVT88_02520 [Candidatus Altiarchaeales archaeon HGW-Altiarchaeales-1]|nr:MAG: hypothetical protein CVT89_01240 [Candidatus Altiarchaeales archaeon HGW-Altiarchaeales-2]PKP60627.1 MAG: hypothetical protein CVT88_02520 [Candidatus Altiarchaeales archaeon HGW-Altiarchaeales-1]
MKKKIIITYFSKWNNGICIFGYDEEYNGIRPIYDWDKEKTPLPWPDNPETRQIVPFTEVEFDFDDENTYPTSPPHTEDKVLKNREYHQIIRTISEKEKKEFLEKLTSKSIKEDFWGTNWYAYNPHLTKNKSGDITFAYIIPVEGKRSIVTIKKKKCKFTLDDRDEVRIESPIKSEIFYSFAITDLELEHYVNKGEAKRIEKKYIVEELNQNISGIDIFLRIGTGRPFKPMPDFEGCFLFVTGIYSFPDYKTKI